MGLYSLTYFVTEFAFCLWVLNLYFASPLYFSIQLGCQPVSTFEFILILYVKTIRRLLTYSDVVLLYVIRVVCRIEHFLAPNMEGKATELLAVLKNNNLAIDVKVSHLLSIKSDIKQKNVPDNAVHLIFESLRLAITSHHAPLYAAGFSTFGHFLKRLFIQDQAHIVSAYARHFCPVLLERLGDHKERVRAQAAQIFTDLWPAASADVEHYVLEVALTGKNPKAKETSLIWLSNMSRNHGLLFRSYVPSVVSCLEDADSFVRHTAKSTVVELFQGAPARAKADLTKEMTAQNVRQSIVNAVYANIGLEDHSSTARPRSRVEPRYTPCAESHPLRSASRAEVVHQQPAAVVSSAPLRPSKEATPMVEPEQIKSRPGSSKSDKGRTTAAAPEAEKASHMEPARPSSQDGEAPQPLHAETSKQVEDLFRVLSPAFEGRESEDNWKHREKYIISLRRLTYGNAPHDFPQPFFAGIKTNLDGIFKAVNSLRTTLSTNGCLLIQDLAKVGGSRMDPMVEVIMQNLIKLCGGMKKISAQNGNVSVNDVLANVTYTPRLLQHVTSACQDKNAQLRLSAAGWLKTLLNKQSHHKSSLEHGGGLALLEKSLKRGLTDANPGIREAMRGAFWTFHRMWPARGNNILSDLDNKTRHLLEKDPANPNRDQSSYLSSDTLTAPSRSALKEAIAAHKKARLAPAKTLPPRPESAQSSFGETKASEPPAKSTGRTARAPLSSLSSAPMRPGAKPRRPELARPATADPYSSRKTTATDTVHIDSSPRPKRVANLGQAPSSTKSKPKKLDIPMTMAVDPVAPSASNENETQVTSKVRKRSSLSEQFAAIKRGIRARTSPKTTPKTSPETSPKLSPQTPPNELDDRDINALGELSISKTDHPDEIALGESSNNEPDRHDDHTPSEISIDKLDRHDDHIPSEISIDKLDGRDENTLSQTPTTGPDCRDENTLSESPTLGPDRRDETALGELSINKPQRREENALSELSINKPQRREENALGELSINKLDRREENAPSKSPPSEPDSRVEKTIDSVEHTSQPHRRVEESEPFFARFKIRNRQSNKRRNISPHSEQLENAKEMVRVAGQRIRSRSFDLFAYRKLQDLIHYHGEKLFTRPVFDDLLDGLLVELRKEPSPDRKHNGDYADVKTQVVGTLRLLEKSCPNLFVIDYDAIDAIFHARRYFETNSWIVQELQQTALEWFRNCEPSGLEGMLDTLVQYVQRETRDEPGYRSILMALSLLTDLIGDANKKGAWFSNEILEQVGTIAARDILAEDTDIRKKSIELCVQLYVMSTNLYQDKGVSFWRLVKAPEGGTRQLIMYYIARQ
ncbi:clasp N terminal-domain-containing protein [Aspergillus transmontanensis]|uniref:Clasp N terminal-domain-containing protein n=1 Tax=Aspergillus transmontanensis TaxID=1034304 RepID=A0A5N6WCP1_9EURO|nr:clasp N terminal-domain-containing protein [Aspergillus transmontanensis]